jgi:hypothetical protein
MYHADNKASGANGNVTELRGGKYGYQENCCKSWWLSLPVHLTGKPASTKRRITLYFFEMNGAEIDVTALASGSITIWGGRCHLEGSNEGEKNAGHRRNRFGCGYACGHVGLRLFGKGQASVFRGLR